MQIANGTLILCPENHKPVYGITPAEAVILFKMHFQNANGSPLGDFFIQEGEAVTIEVPEKSAEPAYFNQASGKHVDAVDAIPAKTHKRTNAEEITRLKKKYTGIVTENGIAMPAFAAAFGSAASVKLPETFAELEIGYIFKDKAEPSAFEVGQKTRAQELGGKVRVALCEIATALNVKVHSQDTKEQIINAILEAEAALVVA